ncbi:MAG: reverse transcriptase-like protein [Fimbriimonadales bacterium]
MQAVAYIGGSSLKNPTYAAIAVQIFDAAGHLLASICEPIGLQTNNYAEYHALVRCLEEACRLGVQRLTVYTDCEPLSKQWTGEYRVKASNIKPLYTTAKALAEGIGVQVVYLQKDSNEQLQLVDRLAHAAAKHIQRFGNLHLQEDDDGTTD